MGADIIHCSHKWIFVRLYDRNDLPRTIENGLRARVKLLLLPGSTGVLPDWVPPGGGWKQRLSVFLLYCRFSDSFWICVWKIHLRVAMSVWSFTGSALQNPVFQKAKEPARPQNIDKTKIYHLSCICNHPSNRGDEFYWNGGTLVLQIHLPERNIYGRNPVGCNERIVTRCDWGTFFLENDSAYYHDCSVDVGLSPIL